MDRHGSNDRRRARHAHQPEIRGEAGCALGGAGGHGWPLREAKLSRVATQGAIEVCKMQVVPIREFRVASWNRSNHLPFLHRKKRRTPLWQAYRKDLDIRVEWYNFVT